MAVTSIELVEQAAAQLRRAAQTRTPCPPLRDLVGSATDIDLGYAIQERNTALDLQSGRRVSGRKIGLTSAAVQAQIGVDQPDFGTLFVDMEFGDGVEVPAERLLQPRAEAEVALVLESDLNRAPHGFAEIVRATAFALPAIEIVDSRIAGWDIRLLDTVADNASCGLYVLGGRPVPLSAVNLRTVTMTMQVNDVETSAGNGAACLGHPLHAARWLADTLCARGIPLRAGDVIMTGALGPMRPIAPGDRVVADMGALGTVTTVLSKGSQWNEGSE
jgi:2-keto-4-pentenoate hydratase